MEATDRLIAAGMADPARRPADPVIPYNLVSYAAGATRVPLGRLDHGRRRDAADGADGAARSAAAGAALDDPVLWAIVLGVIALLALRGRWGGASAASQ